MLFSVWFLDICANLLDPHISSFTMVDSKFKNYQWNQIISYRKLLLYILGGETSFATMTQNLEGIASLRGQIWVH